MSAAVKGYVVRCEQESGRPGMPHEYTGHNDTLAEAVADLARAMPHYDKGSIFRVLDDGREERLPSYEDALGALSILRDEAQAAQNYKRGGMSCGGPPLLWTCPPSALKELLRLANGAPVGDPLAALEAAERRLLEAGGWRIEPSAWTHGAERWERGGENESRQVALTIERRRIAAKGGV